MQMNPSLNSHDRARLSRATAVLASPLAANSFDSWLGEVNDTIKDLIGADKASFMFPWDGDAVHVRGDQFAPPMLVAFAQEKLPEVERRWNLRTRQVALGVSNRRLLYGKHAAAIYRSEYYGD